MSGTDTLNSKRMHAVFEDPISSFTSTATREGLVLRQEKGLIK